MVKMMKNVFSLNIVADKNLFQHLEINIKDNSFAMKNGKVSHSEHFSDASHLGTAGLHLLTFCILNSYSPKILTLISVTLSHINYVIIVPSN